MELKTFFKENPSVALAFSGGCDSSFLLYAALSCGADVTAYFVKTAFQPRFELEDAGRLAGELNARLNVIEADILSSDAVAANPADRCYYCKAALFGLLSQQALADGYTVLIDGTNASDDEGGRPGMRALRELGVRSPLRECGITKDEVRRLSKQAGLFTWDKPAYACLATRVPAGTAITPELLRKVEAAEEALSGMGFVDFRARLMPDTDTVKIQLPPGQIAEAVGRREAILQKLGPYFQSILLDLAGR